MCNLLSKQKAFIESRPSSDDMMGKYKNTNRTGGQNSYGRNPGSDTLPWQPLFVVSAF